MAIEQEPLFSRAHPMLRDVNQLCEANGRTSMRASLSRIAIVLAAMIGLVLLVQPASAHKQAELRTEMHKLWEDHVTWTRNYIVIALPGLDDASAVAQRLLKKQDVGAAITPYYGEAAGKKLTELLRDHNLIALDVVSAAKAEMLNNSHPPSKNGRRMVRRLQLSSVVPIRIGPRRRPDRCSGSI
jgi:hypothetical protein